MKKQRLERQEYVLRARELARRGMEISHTKLTPLDVTAIRSAVAERERLREHIVENLTNKALAKKFGVHIRTIDRITTYSNWVSV